MTILEQLGFIVTDKLIIGEVGFVDEKNEDPVNFQEAISIINMIKDKL